MNVERDILAAACDSREAYVRIVRHLGTEDLTDTGHMVWDVIDAYYQRDPKAGHVDFHTLDDLVRSSVANPKHKETLGAVVEGIGSHDVSGINIVTALINLKKEAVGAKLSTALLSGGDTDALMEEYAELCRADSLDDTVSDNEPVFGWNPADEDNEEAAELLGLAPSSLNERLDGGLMRGHHVIVFARPEMGKTSFLANAVAGFLHQGFRVLYLGNEEPITDVRYKFLGRVIGWPRHEVVADKQAAFEVALNTTNWANLGMMQIEPGTPREIEALVQKYEPDVLVIDQLRNIQVRGNQSDGVVQHLEAAAKAVRQIGIRNKCVVISTTQAGDSATHKAVLEMSDVDSSKTGIPAQADVMIGIGASAEDDASSRRVLSLPKNKRSGRHEFFPVKVDFVTSTFSSLGGR